MIRRNRRLAGVLVAALALAACGDDDDSTSATDDSPTSVDDSEAATTTGEEGSFPVSVDVGGEEVTIDARPEAIVSLSPTATEMLFAIEAGDQVVAVDDQSDFPEDVPTSDLSGFEPNVEAITELDPDLVVLSNDANDVVAGLEAVDVPTLLLPAAETLDDTYTQIEVLGVATGNVGSAAELVSRIGADIDDLTDSVPERERQLTYYHELDPTLFSVTSDTFVGEIYELAGLVNVADEADASGDAGGYPQLSAEYLVEADPDVIFLADTECCGESAETLAERPGFADLAAVRSGNVVELDDDIASRWGPRIVDFLRTVIEATADLEPVGA